MIIVTNYLRVTKSTNKNNGLTNILSIYKNLIKSRLLARRASGRPWAALNETLDAKNFKAKENY